MYTQTGRRDIRAEITDKMIAMIEAGTAPWQKLHNSQ